MTNTALILIDVQEGFKDPCWGKRNNPNFESNICRLLRATRQLGWPIIHVRHDSRSAKSPLRPGQSGHAFMACALPIDGETVIGKEVNSAFVGTDLQQFLLERCIRHLVFAGLATDHCVSTSIRMAANLGFDCTLVSDATATFPRVAIDGEVFDADFVHRVSIASLFEEFASVVQTEQLYTALRSAR